MDDIGDYSQFASKEALRQELIDVYDSSTSRKNQALMAWNFANTVSVNDVILRNVATLFLVKVLSLEVMSLTIFVRNIKTSVL